MDFGAVVEDPSGHCNTSLPLGPPRAAALGARPWAGRNPAPGPAMGRHCIHMLCVCMHILQDKARSCYAKLCYAMLCYAMLCYAMLCYAMLCYAMLCYAMLCYAMLWMHVCLYVCMDACMHVSMYLCIQVRNTYICNICKVCMQCVYVCMDVCVHAFVYVCMHACMYVCMYVCMNGMYSIYVWYVMY